MTIPTTQPAATEESTVTDGQATAFVAGLAAIAIAIVWGVIAWNSANPSDACKSESAAWDRAWSASMKFQPSMTGGSAAYEAGRSEKQRLVAATDSTKAELDQCRAKAQSDKKKVLLMPGALAVLGALPIISVMSQGAREGAAERAAEAQPPVYGFPHAVSPPQVDADGNFHQTVRLTEEQLAETIARAQAAGYRADVEPGGTLFIREQSPSAPAQPQAQPKPPVDDLDDLFDAKLDEV